MATYVSAEEKERKRRDRLELARSMAICLLGPVCFPLTCIYFCYLDACCAYKATPQYKAKKKEQRESRDATPPVPVQRKRALSVSGQLDQGMTTNQQLQSRLCALPAELRLQIYENIIARRARIHVTIVYRRLVTYRCHCVDDPNVPAHHVHCWNIRFKPNAQPDWAPETDLSALGILGLLKSCRVIYTELITHVYSQPTFSFQDWNSFVAFVGAVLPARFESIQSVCLHETQGLRYCEYANSENYNYKALHESAVRVYNSVLPLISRDLKTPIEGREWIQTEEILKKMTALQEVTVIFFLELVITFGTDYQPFQTYNPIREMPQSLFESFWAAHKAENWADFDTIVDKYPQPYYSVQVLRKRRQNT